MDTGGVNVGARALAMGDLTGAVLAGGRSSRFGRDKGLALLGGEPLAAHVLRGFAAFGERFVVLKPEAASAYAGLGAPLQRDLRPETAALCGLESALRHACNDWVALCACDLPFVSATYWRALAAARSGGRSGALAVTVLREGRAEPLASLYHRKLLPQVEARLAAGAFALQALLHPDWTVRLAWPVLAADHGLPEHSLLNLNTTDDLRAAERFAMMMPRPGSSPPQAV